jgi:hypothetical protein
MPRIRHLVMLAVVVASGIGTIFAIDRNHRPIARIDASQKPTVFAGSPRGPIVPAEPLDDVRKAERSRRAVRPAGDPKRENGLNYEGVLNGEGTPSDPRAAEPLPPTYCRLVEPAPKDATWLSGPHRVHHVTLALFEVQSGFGVCGACCSSRMIAALRSRRRLSIASNWSAC